MELQRPFRVITPTLDGDVLEILAAADTDFTAPQVQRLIGQHSVDGVRKALGRLVEQGIALSRPAGQAQLYRLNRDHLLALAITHIARAKELLLERLSQAVHGWAIQCEYGALFGSAARGDMSPSSDIDLFVVRPAEVDADDSVWNDQTMALSRAATSWTGNDARILEYGIDDLAIAAEGRDPLLLSIRKEGLRFVGPADYLDRVHAGRAKVAQRR